MTHSAVRSDEMDAYVAALKAHDWFHSWQRDYLIRRKGRESRKALEQMQQRLDPGCEAWNGIAPEVFRVHVLAAPETNGTTA